VDLKIDSNGNIGIGTTSPAAGYKLDVAGFINSNQTVDQASYPSINAVQTAATLQDGSANTGATRLLTIPMKRLNSRLQALTIFVLSE